MSAHNEIALRAGSGRTALSARARLRGAAPALRLLRRGLFAGIFGAGFVSGLLVRIGSRGSVLARLLSLLRKRILRRRLRGDLGHCPILRRRLRGDLGHGRLGCLQGGLDRRLLDRRSRGRRPSRRRRILRRGHARGLGQIVLVEARDQLVLLAGPREAAGFELGLELVDRELAPTTLRGLSAFGGHRIRTLSLPA